MRHWRRWVWELWARGLSELCSRPWPSRLLGVVLLGLIATTHIACHQEARAPIPWETTLDPALARARAEHRPAMIDFTATWCAGCQELEKRTFVHPTVRQAAARFVAIKVDATVLDDAMQATFNRFNIAALPAIVFVDSQGTVRQSPRVTGFMEAPHFVELLGQVP